MGYINPLLELPAGKELLRLPPTDRARIEAVMRELRDQANAEAENAWRRRKGPMTATEAMLLQQAVGGASTADAVAVMMCVQAGLDLAAADALVWRVRGWLLAEQRAADRRESRA